MPCPVVFRGAACIPRDMDNQLVIRTNVVVFTHVFPQVFSRMIYQLNYLLPRAEFVLLA
jgi:hypothetical protein